MTTVRIPTVDKNGKHTHVYKNLEGDDDSTSRKSDLDTTGSNRNVFGLAERMSDFFSTGKPTTYGQNDFRTETYEESAKHTQRTIAIWQQELSFNLNKTTKKSDREVILEDINKLRQLDKDLSDPQWLNRMKRYGEKVSTAWNKLTSDVQFRFQKRNCTEMTIKPKRSKLLTVAALSLVVAIGFPTIVQAAATPTGWSTSISEQKAVSILAYAGITDTEVRFVTVDDLSILGKDANGYVNMFDSEDVIYLKPFDDKQFGGNNRLYTALVLHEYGHILQKRIIDDMELNNYERYGKLIELNNLLTDNSPDVIGHDGEAKNILFQGIETNADCILGSLSGVIGSAYIDAVEGCDIHGEAMAKAVIAGEFPSKDTIFKWENIVTGEHEADKIKREEELQEYIESGVGSRRGI